MNVSISLKQRVLASAAANPSLTRYQGRWLAAGLVLLSIAVGVALVALQGGFDHGLARPPLSTVRLADGYALASCYLTWLVVGRGGRTQARSRWALAAATLAFPVFLFWWMQYFHDGYAAPSPQDTVRCFVDVVAFGITPLASFLVLRRGVEPAHPGTLGAAAGAMCSGWANVLTFVMCPITSGNHALAGHVLPSALLIAAGAIAGTRMLGASIQ